jgi:hypothetical protein
MKPGNKVKKTIDFTKQFQFQVLSIEEKEIPRNFI